MHAYERALAYSRASVQQRILAKRGVEAEERSDPVSLSIFLPFSVHYLNMLWGQRTASLITSKKAQNPHELNRSKYIGISI